jgi:hypothetical protein
MLYKNEVTKRIKLVGIFFAAIWLFIILNSIEMPKDNDSVEKINPIAGIATLFFFFAMGALFYIRSKFVEFSSYWKYNTDNRLVAYVILGLYMIKMEREDSKSQFRFLKIILNKRFKSNQLDEVIKDNLNAPLPITEVLNWFKKKGGEKEAIEILDFLADLAFYNDNVNRREMSFLMHCGVTLGVDSQTVKSIFSIREQQRRKREEQKRKNTQTTQHKGKNYYKNKYLSVLGLSGNSSFDEVKKAYRQLARKLHPDRFNRKSEEEQQAAHERFTEINLAYDKLKQIMTV